jgi:hypothetical protein
MDFDEVMGCSAGIGDVGLVTDEMAPVKKIARAEIE